MFQRMPFRRQLSVSFALTLTVLVGLITCILTLVATQRAQNDNKAHLSLLTEQILGNFAVAATAIEQQLFDTYTAKRIPQSILEAKETERLHNLQYMVNQMVSVSLPYDFVLVACDGGLYVHTGEKLTDGEAVARQAYALVNQSENLGNHYGQCLWRRTQDGGLYIIRDVYELQPLRRVGKIAARVRQNRLVSLGESNEVLDCHVLFFDSQWRYITTVGTAGELGEALAGELAQKLTREALANVTWRGAEGAYYVTCRAGNKGWNAVGMMPTSRLDGVRATVLRTSLVIGLVGIVIGVGIVEALSRRLSVQLHALTSSMEAVSHGDLSREVKVYSQNDIGQLAVRFNQMTRRVSELLNRVVEEEDRKKDAEYRLLEYRYRSLQSQINPHFIYNALETVNAKAKLHGSPEISRMVQVISSYFRKNTANPNRRFITVEREFSGLQDYAVIYRYIHGDRLQTAFDYSEEAQDALLPTMILQPVVENALIHGLNGETQISRLRVSAAVCGERLQLAVSDNGPGMSQRLVSRVMTGQGHREAERERGGIGIANVRERLRLIYGREAALTLDSTPGEGTRVLMDLPLWYVAPPEP